MKALYNSELYRIDPTMMPLVRLLMSEQLGKDEYLCEGCGQRSTKKMTVHHRKYLGATLYDLAFFCMSCQNKHINKGMA